jgi:hypothetical protein
MITQILQDWGLLTGLHIWIAIDVFQIKFKVIKAPALTFFVE